MIIENTGTTIWNEYYLECINGDNFHTQKENYVYHSKNVLCLVKGSPSKWNLQLHRSKVSIPWFGKLWKEWNTGVPEKQEAWSSDWTWYEKMSDNYSADSIPRDIWACNCKDTEQLRCLNKTERRYLVPAGRNRKNNMNYVVTILTEKYLYRVNIEGGIKYNPWIRKKRFISDVRAWYRWAAWDVF